MNRGIKLILPLAAVAAVVLAGSNIRFAGGCACRVPLALFGSILGCGGPSSDESARQSGAPQIDAAPKGQLEAAPAPEKYTGPVKVTFIELGSVNCIPCKMMQPVMKQLEEKYRSQVKVVFYDVWTQEQRQYANEYGIQAIPTQIFLDKDGKEYFRHTGYFPFEDVEKILKKKDVK